MGVLQEKMQKDSYLAHRTADVDNVRLVIFDVCKVVTIATDRAQSRSYIKL